MTISLQQWKTLSKKERNDIWLKCETDDPAMFRELWQIEWELAQQFFSKDENKNTLKMSHKAIEGTTRNSFIQINGKIYMLARKDKLLGEGAFGKVKPTYFENDEADVLDANGNNYIVKVIKTEDPSGEAAVGREAHALEKMGELYDQGERTLADGSKKYYLIAKRHQGTSLYKLTEAKKLTRAQLLVIAYQCCELLQTAHQKGILHLDIKPENFLVEIRNGAIKVKLIDWGLSVPIHDIQEKVEVDICGTPGYISPEILNDHPLATQASDIFSLGAMFKSDFDLLLNEFESMIHHDPEKRISLEQQKKTLLNALDLLLDDEKTNEVITFINEVKNKPQTADSDSAPRVDLQSNWRVRTYTDILNNLKEYRVNIILKADDRWMLEAKGLGYIINELETVVTNIALDDPEKLIEFDQALRKAEKKYYGMIKILLGEQLEYLEWEHAYNSVFDVYSDVFSLVDDKVFFQEQIQPVIDAFRTIDADFNLTVTEKSTALYKAIDDIQESYIEKAIDDPRYLTVIDALKQSLEVLTVPSSNLSQEDAERGVDELLASFGIQSENNQVTDDEVVDDDLIDRLMNEMDLASESDTDSHPTPVIEQVTVETPRIDQLIQTLVEFNQVHHSEKLAIIINSLQSKMQRIYYQRNPKQCVEAVMAENDMAMDDVETAAFLLEQLEPWQVATPKLHEQTEEYHSGVAFLAQLELEEENKLALIKENIFEYAIYLIKQKATDNNDKSEFYSGIIKHINYRKRIDVDNESFLINLLDLQKNKADKQRFAPIMDDIVEIYQQLATEFHIDLSTLPEKLAKRKVRFQEAEIVIPSSVMPSRQVVDLNLNELSRLLTVDEAFLNKHAVIKLILQGLQESLAIKRDPSASQLVLEMTKLLQKIESFPDDMPHRSKLAIIKSYLSNKQNELQAQQAAELLKQLNENVSTIFSRITTTLQDQEWTAVVALEQQNFAATALSAEKLAKVQLLQRAIDLFAEKFIEINKDAAIKWDLKPTKDDLTAISSQVQHKLALFKEGLLKINPEQELLIIFKNASMNPRLNQLIRQVADHLQLQMDFSEVKPLERHPDEVTLIKEANAKRAAEITRVKNTWAELAQRLCAKENPDSNDYMAFSDQFFNEAIKHLENSYQDANAVQRKNLGTHVTPMLQQYYAALQEKVIRHYIAHQQQRIIKLKKEHADISDQEHEALRCKNVVWKKLGIVEKPELKPDSQYQDLRMVIPPKDLKEQIARLKAIPAKKSIKKAVNLQDIQEQKIRMQASANQQSALAKLLAEKKQLDEDYLNEKRALDEAYHLIIAYDRNASERSMPYYTDYVLDAMQMALEHEQDRIKNAQIAQDISHQIENAKLANIELVNSLQRKIEEAQGEKSAQELIMIEQINNAMLPISLEDDILEPIAVDISNAAPVIKVEHSHHYHQFPLVNSFVHIQEQEFLPTNEPRIKEQIYEFQLAELDSQAREMIKKHRENFVYDEQDLAVLERIKEIAHKVKLLKQKTAELQGPSLDSLLKELNDLKIQYENINEGFQQKMADIDREQVENRRILGQFLNEKRADRYNSLVKFKQLAKTLDDILLDPVGEYHAKLKHQEQLFARKWFKNKAKAVGRRVYGKERSRTKQTKFIEDLFLGIKQDIESSDVLSVKEKAMMAYQCLAQVQKEILDERNVFTSDLFKVCETKMHQLEAVLEDLQELEPSLPDKPDISQEAFLRMVIYQPRNASDPDKPLLQRLLENCKKYLLIPQDYTQFGNGGTLSMLESSIARDMDGIHYFAHYGEGRAQLEAIKLEKIIKNEKLYIDFQLKVNDRKLHLDTRQQKRPEANSNLTVKLSKEQQKVNIEHKIIDLQRKHLLSPNHVVKPKK